MKIQQPGTRDRIRQGLLLFVALLLLNAALTFHNVWPTLGVRWRGELSVELAGLLALLAGWSHWLGTPSRRLLAVLSAVYVLLVLGRYAEVTAPALYGREINLYWDAQHLRSLVGMLTGAASIGLAVTILLGIILILALLYIAARLALGQVATGLQSGTARQLIGVLSLLLLAWFGLQQIDTRVPQRPQFSIPVSKTYSTQIKRVLDTFSSSRAVQSLPTSPSMASDLSALAGADVLLIFLESYGSTTYDNPRFRQSLLPIREQLAATIRDTGRGVVSGFVASPTFGGNSWLAHLSLLSGIEVRDPDRYALLMTQHRPTFASTLAQSGYRNLAVMPGLSRPWPEGSFYHFDEIYGTANLDYQGPEFGWWRIPDQYALAKLDQMELQPQPRKPVFVFFPTITTHFPFRPTPPYQPDWRRLLTPQAFDAAPLQEALAQKPDWTDLGKAYASSIGYTLQSIDGLLRQRASNNFVMVIIGDHQPAASVSGENASWDVPVHVIASNPQILAALQARGFSSGLTPPRKSFAAMHELGPILMSAFGKDADAAANEALR